MKRKSNPKSNSEPPTQNESRRNFQDEQRALAWATISDPYGDPYRQSIINPIVYGLIEDLAIMEQSEKESLDYSDDDSPLSDALARYYANVCKKQKTLHTDTEKLGWFVDINSDQYQNWFRMEPEGNLASGQRFHVLDLGCGDGYRGRWLGQKRFSYTGVDYSKTLIKIAKERFNALQLENEVNVLFKEIDLRTEPATIIKDFLKEETRIILAITILDHLNDADTLRLLQSLSAKTGAMKRCYLLVATCNPDYYKKLEYDNDATAEGCCKQAIGKLESLLENEACDVEFFPRSTAQYKRLFRDAGLLIIDQVTPISQITLQRNSEEIYEKGTGPFHVWLLSLHGRTFSKTALISDKHYHIEPSSVAGKVIAKLEEKKVSEVKTMTVAAGRPIVGMNNAGGSLFLLLSGEACLHAHSSRIPKMPFRPGSLFGDLELPYLAGPTHDKQLRATSYRQSVIAAKESTLAVIEESDVQDFLTSDSIEGELHKLLRIRLQSQLWLMDAKSAKFGMNVKSVKSANSSNFSKTVVLSIETNGKPLRRLKDITISKSVPISEVHIQACHFVAACLVAALERQRSAFPDLGLGNNVIFIPNIKKNVESVGQIDQVVEGIRILVSAGIIYSAPLTANRAFWEKIDNTLNRDDPLKKLTTDGNPRDRFIQYVHPDKGPRNQTAFFLIENEWALRKIAARPGYGMTRLIDNFLFLNSAHNKVQDRLKQIPTLDDYASSSAASLTTVSPEYQARFSRFKSCVEDYLRGVIKNNIAEDSLGFSLGAEAQ